jgi:hypothetical protein
MSFTVEAFTCTSVTGISTYRRVKSALQRQNTEILKQIFPEKEYRGLSSNFHIHASVSDLYISTIVYSAGHGIIQIAHRNMNVEIGAVAALFPAKEYRT